ncbi:MAG: hypothetical protein ACYC9O_14010, partial [Candidatus Latescibacterota bacterium]
MPNGASRLQADWGENGQAPYHGAWPAGWNFGPGVVSDGRDYLFVVNADISGSGSVSELIYLDVTDGAEIRRLDLSEWWVDLNDALSGGQYSGGPTELFIRHDLMTMGSHSSCVNM